MIHSSINNSGIVITNISPNTQNGKYNTKIVVDEIFKVEADIFKDSHQDILRGVLKYKKSSPSNQNNEWQKTPLLNIYEDRWISEPVIATTPNNATNYKRYLGFYDYELEVWVDRFKSWLGFYIKKVKSKSSDVLSEKNAGILILEEALDSNSIKNESNKNIAKIKDVYDIISKGKLNNSENNKLVNNLEKIHSDEDVLILIDNHLSKYLKANSDTYKVWVDRKKAVFGSWYEFFPRNAKNDGKTHGKFNDCIPMLDYIKNLGFNIVYFPPIHPIGEKNKKGKNNAKTSHKDDVGSPWAIGNKNVLKNKNNGSAGGYYDIEPKLGNLKDFKNLLKEMKQRDLEIALDFALNCSPDHPYVDSHPDWFFKRPDGSIRYAENPPKKYEDIYPLNFHCDDWENLWNELVNVVKYWIKNGVKIFRVDNPHTKPISFWKYLIGEIHQDHPEVIFLSEAFTKPNMMLELAKIGFTQGYSYFTWRNSKEELSQYCNDIFKTDWRYYYRANFWTNTPDILPFSLQHAPIEAFKPRLILAALMTPSWGMFCGYEFGENSPIVGKEEYIDSDKYELKKRDYDSNINIKNLIQKLNYIRDNYAAFQNYANLDVINTDMDDIFSFCRYSDDEAFIVIINLNYLNHREGNVFLPENLCNKNLKSDFIVKDLLNGQMYNWYGTTNYVSLDPKYNFAHVFQII